MTDAKEEERHLTLKAILVVCSIATILGGVFAILLWPSALGELMSAFARREIVIESATSALVLKLFGALLLTWGVLLYSASFDPVRNAAIVRGSIVGFLAIAVAQLLAVATTDLTRDFSLPLLLVRPALCLAIAALLFRCRPDRPKRA